MAEPTRLELADKIDRLWREHVKACDNQRYGDADGFRRDAIRMCGGPLSAALRSADADLTAKTLALDEAFKRIDRADEEIARLTQERADWLRRAATSVAVANQADEKREKAEGALAEMRRMVGEIAMPKEGATYRDLTKIASDVLGLPHYDADSEEGCHLNAKEGK